jgi:hypothetical protein
MKEWEAEIVAQCRRRAVETFPSIEEFILARRRAIGQSTVESKPLLLVFVFFMVTDGIVQ